MGVGLRIDAWVTLAQKRAWTNQGQKEIPDGRPVAADEGSLQKANMLIGAKFAQLVAVLLLGWAVWLILQMN